MAAKDLSFETIVSIDPAKLITTDKAGISRNKADICTRDEKGRFLKGFSGNPNAWATRKLNTPLALLCREKVEKWADILDSLIGNPDVDAAVRLGGLKLGFEYGYGKPLQGSEVRRSEGVDYDNFIKYLTRELHEKFNFREGDIIAEEKNIKEFIMQKTEDNTFINKIFDDILKHVGSYHFQSYVEELNAGNVWYKYIE